MTDKKDLIDLARTPAYTKLLFERVLDGPMESNYMNQMSSLSMQIAEAVVLDFYHGIELMFQAYPSLLSLKPTWKPALDGDDIHIRFAVKISANNEGGEVEQGLYAYEGNPPCLWGNPRHTYDTLVELGEAVGSDIWKFFKDFDICQRSEPYTSVEEVREAKKADVGELLTRFEQHALSQITPETPRARTRKTL
jgi:hypothetical protein